MGKIERSRTRARNNRESIYELEANWVELDLSFEENMVTFATHFHSYSFATFATFVYNYSHTIHTKRTAKLTQIARKESSSRISKQTLIKWSEKQGPNKEFESS